MPKYKNDDLLTMEQVADHFGYTCEYLRALHAENSKQADPLFRRIRIKTDPTWRAEFNSHAQYVYRYRDLKEWFQGRQTTPTVQAYNQAHGIIVDL